MENKFFSDSKLPAFSDEKSFQDFDFDSFSDFNDSGSGNITNNEVSSINVDEYAFQELDLEAKYRSIQTVNPNSFSAYHSPALNSMAPPSLSKAPMHTNTNQVLSKAPQIVVQHTTKPIVVPDQPFYVAVTQFTTTQNIETLVSMIESELSNVVELSYEFTHEKCRWDCVYLCGPTRCKYEFNVYKNGLGSYIVEGNRLCGDSFPFSTMFRALRSKFTDDACSSPKSVLNFQFIPLPEAALELSPSEIEEAVVPILSMVASGMYESQVNAAHIFCDLSLQQDMLEVLCQPRCINALVTLSRVEFNYCNQHALCALANLSHSRSCQEVLLSDESFLRSLMQHCCNGTYNTAEMRRECARLFANLCQAKTSALKFYQVVGQDDVTQWIDSIDDITDSRLHLHAERARQSLLSCLV
jgi:hypothetical protein